MANISGSLVNSVPDYRFRGNPHSGLWDRLGIDLPRKPGGYAGEPLTPKQGILGNEMPPFMMELLEKRLEAMRREMEERRRMEEFIQNMPKGWNVPDTMNRFPTGMPYSEQGGVILPGGVLATET
jgi:hypothetical protein